MWFWECKGNKSNISIDPLIYIMFTVLEFHSLFFPPPPSPPCFDFISRKTVYDENRSWRMICGSCLLSVRLTEHFWPALGGLQGFIVPCFIVCLPDIFKVLSFHFLRHLLTWLRCYVAQILLRWVSWLSYIPHTLIDISVRQFYQTIRVNCDNISRVALISCADLVHCF